FDFHLANSTYTAEEFYDSVSAQKNPRRSSFFFNTCWKLLRAPGIPVEERIFVCPRGVNAGMFTSERRSDNVKRLMRELAGATGDSILLLYAGRISPEKNINLLVDLMKNLADDTRDFRLLIAGDGPRRGWLKTKADKVAPGKVIFL